MKYKNVTLLGTSHIAIESIKEVNYRIINDQPNLIALELDKNRFKAILSKKRSKTPVSAILKIGLKGYLFAIAGQWVEEKLGKMVGVLPGSEMKEAIRLAKKQKIGILLIDQDIQITLRRLSKALTWKEKWNFFVDILKAVILRKKEIEFDLTKVPSDKVIRSMMSKVKKRYPNFYKVLVEERNEVMGKNLARIMKEHPDETILAVVGAGHVKEIMDIIKKYIHKIDISYTVTVGSKTQKIK